MATSGAAAALALGLVFGVDAGGFAIILPLAAASAGLMGAIVMPWIARKTRFGAAVAGLGGVLVAALSHIPFTLALLIGFLVDVTTNRPHWPNPGVEGVVEFLILGVVLGPIFSAPATAPFGAIGGVVCWTVARRRAASASTSPSRK